MNAVEGNAITRRGFMGAMGLAALGGAAAFGETALASEGTPEEIEAIGGSTMSLAEVNRRRHELVDSKQEYVCSDGTVIPAVYNKLRTLFDTYGNGMGEAKTDNAFNFLMMLYTEDEAQAYLEMPFGEIFTVYDFATASGRDEDECQRLCDDLAMRGLLYRVRRAGVSYYHHVAVIHGIYEYCLDEYYDEGWIGTFLDSFFMQVRGDNLMLTAGTPFYYSLPCDESVVADEHIVSCDDWQKIVGRNEVICVAPCQCRLTAMAANGIEAPELFSEELKTATSPICDHKLETCMVFGEEAQYYIDKGVARQIDADEALSILQGSVEAGMILQSCFTRESKVVCSCHGDCCAILGSYLAAGPEACAESVAFQNASHYVLEYDREACIQCGVCAGRCPMGAIAMDGDGYPEVNATCMRCGQCGMICPMSARKLAAKPADAMPQIPFDLMEDYNLKAAYRFEHDGIR